MRGIYILATLFILAGCSGKYNTSEPASEVPEDEVMYTEEELQEAVDTAYNEGYEEGHLAGYDEGEGVGYSTGYDEGYDAGVALAALPEETPSYQPSVSSSSSPISSGLNLFSDGMDWSIATNYEKKEFIRSAAEATGSYLTFSDVEDYVFAIDMYYESNSNLKTLEDALLSLK